jgi:thiamine-phosphate pyrophosphorylase
MLLYLITDRLALGAGADGLDRLAALAADAALAGIDYVQIRERDLSASALVELARRVKRAVAGSATRVLVNDRFDVALAAGLDGVHLATHSLDVRAVREAVGDRLLVFASTHSEAEVRAARDAGADLVVCGPVFDTPSKRGMGAPLGAARLGRIAAGASIPVVALGGISLETVAPLRGRVAGVAAIRAFQDAWKSGGREALTAAAADLRRGI